MEVVDDFNHEEDDKSNDEEVDNILDEIAIGNDGLIASAEEVGDSDGELGEVDAASDEPDNWHDDVVYKGINNGSKGRANDDAYGEVDDRAAVDEFSEFFAEGATFFVELGEVLFSFGGFF